MIEYYFYCEELLDLPMEEKQLDQFIDTLNNDNGVLKYSDCYFFTELTYEKYPELESITDEYNTFTEYIKGVYQSKSDIYLTNEIYVQVEYMEETAVIFTEYDEEYHEEFLKNPEQALKALDKKVKTYTLSSVIGHLIQDAKENDEDNIEINWEIVITESGL